MLYTTSEGIQKEIEELQIDLVKGLKSRSSDIKYKRGDRNSRQLVVQLVDGSTPFDLSKYHVRLYALKPDGTKVWDDCEINDVTHGVLSITLKEQFLSCVGTVNCEFLLTAADDSFMATPTFKIKVEESINDENAIESTNEFRALLNAIDTVDNLDNKMELLESETDTKLTSVNVQLANKAYKSYVTPEEFGAKGDGITDDGVALREAFKCGGHIVMQSKNYFSSKQLIIPSNTIVHGNNATITFTNNEIEGKNYDYGYLVNENSSYLYRPERAKNITIENLTVTKTKCDELEKALILLSNVEDVTLTNVKSVCTLLNDKINSLDILINCRNVKITGCTFVQKQMTAVGGVWVRNRMTLEESEDTKNITFDNCDFVKAGGIDEILAIFGSNPYNGVYSKVSDVSVNNCRFECLKVDGYESSPYMIMITNVDCKNVKFDNCKVKHHYINQSIFKTKPNMVGESNPVYINNCTIEALGYSDNNESRRVFFSEHCTNVFQVTNSDIHINAECALANGVIFKKCNIYNSSSSVAFTDSCKFYNCHIDIKNLGEVVAQGEMSLYDSIIDIELPEVDKTLTMHTKDIINTKVTSNNKIVLQVQKTGLTEATFKNNILVSHGDFIVQNLIDNNNCPTILVDGNYFKASNVFCFSKNSNSVVQNIIYRNNIFNTKYYSLNSNVLLNENNVQIKGV